MGRLNDAIKGACEDETLRFFAWARQEAGGPRYEYVRSQERPDRVIRLMGSSTEIGVEITRVTSREDAERRRQDIFMTSRLNAVLRSCASGGWMSLYAGHAPDTSPGGIDALVEKLQDEIRAVGSLRLFVAGLDRGEWEHRGTVYHFSRIGECEGWRFPDNHVADRGRSVVPAADLDREVLARATDKARKVPTYGWAGTILVLIRNPYQAYSPSSATCAAIAAMFRSMAECWLVNHPEGALGRTTSATTTCSRGCSR